jgi:hypothetical protein
MMLVPCGIDPADNKLLYIVFVSITFGSEPSTCFKVNGNVAISNRFTSFVSQKP